MVGRFKAGDYVTQLNAPAQIAIIKKVESRAKTGPAMDRYTLMTADGSTYENIGGYMLNRASE